MVRDGYGTMIDLHRTRWDVIVVGAGPAGAMAAQTCAAAGRKTLLLEKATFQREKPCGGGITSKVLREFDIPSTIVERKIDTIRLHTPTGARLDIPLTPSRCGATVRRSVFDRYLVSEARAAGAVTVEQTAAIAIQRSDERVWLRASDPDRRMVMLEAPLVIGCDGAHSPLRRWCGLDAKRRDRIAVQYTYYLALPRALIERRIGDAFELYIGASISASSYAWLFPKREELTLGLGALASELKGKSVPLKRKLDRLRTEHPVLARKIDGARVKRGTPSMMAYPGSAKRTFAPGILLAGDAAGQANMASGEGVYFAMAAGQLAGRWASLATATGQTDATFLSGYEREWGEAFGAQLDGGVKRRLKEGGYRQLQAVVEHAKDGSEEERERLHSTIVRRLGW